MRISDWSSDVCSSDLAISARRRGVTYVSTAPAFSPASAIRSLNMRARSSHARACIRAGISSEKSSSRKSAIGDILPPVLFHPAFAAALRQLPHAGDIGLTLGDRDHRSEERRVGKEG